MTRLLVFLCILALAAEVMALDRPLFQQEMTDDDVTNEINNGGLRSIVKIPRFETLESVISRLHVLPMKRSIAIGRAGFRPGKRSVAIYGF